MIALKTLNSPSLCMIEGNSIYRDDRPLKSSRNSLIEKCDSRNTAENSFVSIPYLVHPVEGELGTREIIPAFQTRPKTIKNSRVSHLLLDYSEELVNTRTLKSTSSNSIIQTFNHYSEIFDNVTVTWSSNGGLSGIVNKSKLS